MNMRARQLAAQLLRDVGLTPSGVSVPEDDDWVADALASGSAFFHAAPPVWGIPIGTPLPMGCLVRFPPRSDLHFLDRTEEELQLSILWAVHPDGRAEVNHYSESGTRRVLVPRTDVDVSVPCPLDTTGSSYVRF